MSEVLGVSITLERENSWNNWDLVVRDKDGGEARYTISYTSKLTSESTPQTILEYINESIGEEWSCCY